MTTPHVKKGFFSSFRNFQELKKEEDDGSSSDYSSGSSSPTEMQSPGSENPLKDLEFGKSSISVRQIVPDSTKETHYVIMVHGTFDPPPKSGPKPWYMKDINPGNFCYLLSQELGGTHYGSESIWRPLPDMPKVKLPSYIPYPFHWDGANTHDARRSAGKSLGKLIHAIGSSDPTARIHLIAHSHGGNVVLKGILKYLTKLRKEAGKSQNKEITANFWAVHRKKYDAIAQYQNVSGIPWYKWLMGPFAAVKRPWMEEEEVGEFWWGCWRITDKLFGYSRARQTKYLRKKWASSPSTNALGNIVFMGTPFYSKYWERGAWASMAIYIISCSVIVSVVVACTVAAVEYWVHTQLVSFTGPYAGPIWAAIGICSLLYVTFSTLTGKRYVEGNLYFTEARDWSPEMKALVLNAGKLDEAALALSTEPLVRAYLIPQVKAMLTPEPLKGLKPIPGKNRKESFSNLYHNFWLLVWNAFFSVPLLCLYILNTILVPYFSNAILRLFMNLGFGLQKNELDNAQVYVEEVLLLPPKTHNITHWNVQKILTAPTDTQIPGEEKMKALEQKEIVEFVAERWKFLWDDEELEKKAENSQTLQRLRHEPSNWRHNPRATKVAFERELKLICVALEERYKDMTGNVELSHGSYFRNRIVISAITHFLVNGKLPTWAENAGEVVDVGNL